jgi:desulfoferrodoxin (superoxide reductase-like protein)
MITFDEEELISISVAVHKLSHVVEPSVTLEWINMIICNAKVLESW